VRRLLVLVCAIVLADTMLYAALVPLLPHYAHEFGLSKGGAGLLVAAYAAGVFIGAVPAGMAAARYGPRRAVLVGLSIMLLTSVAFGFADDAWTLGMARFVQGLGSALSWAGGLSWLIARTPRERRGEMLGTAIGSAILGALLGPAVGAVAHEVGPGPTFSGLAVLFSVLVVWAARTPPADAEALSVAALGRAVREPGILASLWLMVLPAIVFGVVGVLVPLDLDRSGWGAAGIAAAFIVAAAIEMVVAPVIGRLSDRSGRMRPLRIALAGAVVVTVAFALSSRPVVLVPVLVFSAITFGAFWAPAMAMLADGAERVGLAQGLAFGLMNAAWGAGNALGPSIGGALADAAGDALPYGLMAAVCGVTLAAAAALGTRMVRVPDSP
jgi:MFS family permease